MRVRDKEQQRAYARSHYALNKERYANNSKNYSLKAKYGITLEQFKTMVSDRGGKCEICQDFKGNDLVVDHDHKTGKVRGLLCNSCNAVLGHMNDDPNLLCRAVNYLCGACRVGKIPETIKEPNFD